MLKVFQFVKYVISLKVDDTSLQSRGRVKRPPASERRRTMNRSILAVMVVAALVIMMVPSTAVDAEIPDGTPTFNQSEHITEVSDGVYTISFDQDYTVSGDYISLPSDATSVTIEGNNHTLYGGISLDVLFNEGDTTHFDVVIENFTLDGSYHTGQYYGVHAMNQNPESPSSPARTVGFEMRDCTVQGFDAKGVYLVNVTDVLLDNVIFKDNATFEDSETQNNKFYRWGDYLLNIDVTGTTCTSIQVLNCTFTGQCGDLAAVKIAQRGGANDSESMGDAIIASVTFSGNDFSGVSVDTPKDILIGSEPNMSSSTSTTLRDYNSAFPVSITSEGDTIVSIWGDQPWTDNNLDLSLGNGTRVRLNGSIEGEGGSIQAEILSGSADVSGVMGTNVSLLADDGSSVSFQNFTNAGGNTVTIREGAQYYGDPGSNLVLETSQSTPGPGRNGDDDEDYIPPVYVVQDSGSGSDDTVTVVACGAAAVVAALMAAFLILDRKR